MIFIDPRVGSKHLAPLFDKLGAEYEITPLEYGDCAFIGNGPDGLLKVGIEIKGGRAGSDFLSSMQSGRLAGHQAPGMAYYERRYLIVEGLRPTRKGVIWQPPMTQALSGRGRARPIFLSDVRRYITGIEESGLRVRYSRTPNDTARIIVKELYAFWQKEYDEHQSINPLYVAPLFSLRREDEATARIRRVLLALKAGVGAGRSKNVAQHFGSIYALVTSNVEDWKGIEGVGRTIAGEVVTAVRAEIANRTHRAAPVLASVSKARVSPGGRAADRSTRHPRRRQDRELDTGARAQRRVLQARRGSRKPARH